MSDRTTVFIAAIIGGVIALDLIGAVAVSLIADRVPMVLGDVAKVGMGALATLITGRVLAAQRGEKP